MNKRVLISLAVITMATTTANALEQSDAPLSRKRTAIVAGLAMAEDACH